MGGVKSRFSEHLAKPGNGIIGWFVKLLMIRSNSVLEKQAVRLCNIQPHYKVLEIGFGPGIGLEEAFKYVKDGPGVIYGVDISETMILTATERLQSMIAGGKIKLQLASVTKIPHPTNTFDTVFHTNCFFFWENMIMAVQEIKRVIKPDSILVTTLDMQALKHMVENGFMTDSNSNAAKYIDALETLGFKNVHIDQLSDRISGRAFQAIIAISPC